MKQANATQALSGVVFFFEVSEGENVMTTLLVIDNYDSFTYNLVQMFSRYDLNIKVFRSDRISIRQAKIIDPDYILISPGPKNPSHAGISIQIIKNFYTKVPLLGVCLGMQCINEAFNGTTKRAPVPVHGKTSSVSHNNKGIFKDMPDPFTAARYHSLVIEPCAIQNELQITAFCDDKIIMGVSHKDYPLFGVQFHPESFLTEDGFIMIENFLNSGILNINSKQDSNNG